ncbi:MAG: radical SAM protein [Candidatus Altiarchaeota archaeon]
MNLWNQNWFDVKINHDYFSLSSRWENLRYFLGQGHVVAHVKDRFKWHFGPRFFHVFDFPSHVDIETSSLCQMQCPMCGRHLMKKRGIQEGNMEFDLYKKVIDECVRERVYSVKLSWRGEPLLNPKIVDMVKYAKDSGIKDVSFLTNGERLNPELSKKLVDVGLDWMSFSIDGLDGTYERIRYPEKFENIVKKVKFLKEYRDSKVLKKPLIRVQTIWSAIRENPEKYRNFWLPVADRINFIADEIRSDEKMNFIRDPNYICQSPWQRMAVMWDGRVAQCHSDYLEGNILGDVKEQSLRDIWHGEAFNRVRDLMKNKRRLKLAPCQLCCDGGITKEEVIKVGNKKIKMNVYIDQHLDIKSMDARPKGIK